MRYSVLILLLNVILIFTIPTESQAVNSSNKRAIQSHIVEIHRANASEFQATSKLEKPYWSFRLFSKKLKKSFLKNRIIKKLQPSPDDEILFNWSDTRIRIATYLLAGGLLVRILQISILNWIGYLAILLGLGILIWALFDPKGVIKSYIFNHK